MPDRSSPRVALLGFSIECNKFAPPATKAHFLARTYLEGDAIVEEARSATPRMLPETPGFVAAMDASGPWTPVGIALAMTEPNGPVEHAFFVELLDTIEPPAESRAAGRRRLHLLARRRADDRGGRPRRGLVRAVRQIVGPDVPIAATLDLHANVSERMVESIDAFIGYRTNPHLDMRERGAEAAAAIREMLGGVKPQRAFIRLPIVPPTVTMLTAAGPYAEMIDLGQRRMTPEIMNVSVMGGFAFADTAKNGLTVVVTARHDKRAAETLAGEIAELGWANRARFYPRLTSLDEAVEKAARGRPRSFACRRSPLPMSPTTRAAVGAATRHSCCARFTRRAWPARCSASFSTPISPPRRTGTGSARISRRGSTDRRPPSSPSLMPRRQR